jgi:ABC-type lipoprotein export system ATPase subunit
VAACKKGEIQAMSSEYPRGSQWRKWDLQVQTIIDEGYISISEYADDLKAKNADKWTTLCNRLGSEELVKKYDSKSYFSSDPIDDEKQRSQNYAKLFIAYLDIFNDDEIVICVTDHNYYHPHLIDALLKESRNTKVTVLPGVEINVGGVHKLVIFDKLAYGKTTYAESIKHFLSQIDIHNPKEDGVLTVSSKSYTMVLDEIEKLGAIVIYAHCNSSNGLFQERGRTDRTQLASHYNYQPFNILQAKTKSVADATSAYILSSQSLKSGHVFTLGSDARSLKDILQPDDAGNYCWLKADPTFEGLKQIIYEPVSRVYIGAEPELMAKVTSRPTRFIDRLKINQITGYNESRGVWFKDIDIPFNHEMVAVVGNKGSGKSAIADILGLLGESKNIEAASFLNSNRFKKSGLAKNFEAELVWASEDKDEKNLFDDVDVTSVEKIKYLPQRWFEELCNDLDGKQFSKELEKVVYTHLDEAEKLGCDSFQGLIELKSSSVEEDISDLKDSLHGININVASVLKKLHPDYAKKLDSELAQKKRELESHLKLAPMIVENPDKDKADGDKSASLMASIQSLNSGVGQLMGQIQASNTEQGSIRRKLENLSTIKEDIARIKKNADITINSQTVKEIFGEATDKLVQIIVDDGAINTMGNQLNYSLQSEINKTLTETEIKARGLEPAEEQKLLTVSLQVKLAKTIVERDDLKKKLEKPQEEYQKFLDARRKWQARKEEIEGAEQNPEKNTINYFVVELKKVKTEYISQLQSLRREQSEKSQEIYAKKNEIVQIYGSVKSKVDAVIAANKPSIEDYSINVEAGFTMSPTFREQLMSLLNLRAKGSFMVKETAYRVLSTIIDDKDYDDILNITKIQDSINSSLEEDIRADIKDGERVRYIPDQVTDVVSFYDYLYGLDYLTENYQLRLDNKNIESLSPGEKGALLLVFYLMLDQDDMPLVIDQPEDNLDNQSVARILVKFINGAKSRRQIIIVTHNPNLAVVADAEQVIYTHFNKSNNKNIFSVESGSIENDSINKHIVDVLEGTMPAFDKRRLRYFGQDIHD